MNQTDYLVPGYEESYSLWLMPQGGTAQLLQKEIDSLGASHGAPLFQPHVTLLPDIRLPGEQVVSKTKELADKVKVDNMTDGCVHTWAWHPPSHMTNSSVSLVATALLHQLCQRHARQHLLPVHLHLVCKGEWVHMP